VKNTIYTAITFIAVLFILGLGFIDCQRAKDETKLYFRENWKEIPAATPVTQEHVNNPELIMRRYGASADNIRKSHHDNIPNDPFYVWSGQCKTNWALTLHKENSTVDLSSDSQIRWRTRQSGGRILRVVLGIQDDKWFVSEQGTGATPDWEVSVLALDTLKWRSLDINNVESGELLSDVDLRKIKYIGFSDLMSGGGSEACSRLDWIEVYEK